MPGTLRATLQRWVLPAAIASTAIAFELGGEPARLLFRYQRDAVLEGEAWRLFTGNLVHLGPRHMALNLAGLALIMMLAARLLQGLRGTLVALGSMVAVGLGLLWFAPNVAWYVGSSGLLHGLLTWIVLQAMLTPGQRVWGGSLLVLLVIKLGWEQGVGPLPLTATLAGGPVVVAAHLFGAFGGAATGLALRLVDSRRSAAPRRV